MFAITSLTGWKSIDYKEGKTQFSQDFLWWWWCWSSLNTYRLEYNNINHIYVIFTGVIFWIIFECYIYICFVILFMLLTLSWNPIKSVKVIYIFVIFWRLAKSFDRFSFLFLSDKYSRIRSHTCLRQPNWLKSRTHLTVLPIYFSKSLSSRT